MLFIGKPLSEITENDLRTLISDQAVEDRTLDFKQCLPGNTDADKKEFLADVSSFANSAGGFIIYGLAECEGHASGLPGCLGVSDTEQTRLVSLIHAGIAPHIPGIDSQKVPLSNGNWCMILYIPRSWASPHMVSFGGPSRFCARHSNGKQWLDVEDIRQAFALSQDLNTRLRDFRLDRLSRIVSLETPVPLLDEPRIIMHLVPIEALQHPASLDLPAIRTSDLWRNSYFFSNSSPFLRYNLDGLLLYSVSYVPQGVGDSLRYVQLFRTGIIEAVDAHLLRHLSGNDRYIKAIPFENLLLPYSYQALSLLRQLGLRPPILLFISLVGVKGYSIRANMVEPPYEDSGSIDRSTLLLPEIWLDEYPPDMSSLITSFKPAFDALWNAAGYSEWLLYSDCVQRYATTSH